VRFLNTDIIKVRANGSTSIDLKNKIEFILLKLFGASGYLQNSVKEKKLFMIHPTPQASLCLEGGSDSLGISSSAGLS